MYFANTAFNQLDELHRKPLPRANPGASKRASTEMQGREVSLVDKSDTSSMAKSAGKVVGPALKVILGVALVLGLLAAGAYCIHLGIAHHSGVIGGIGALPILATIPVAKWLGKPAIREPHKE